MSQTKGNTNSGNQETPLLKNLGIANDPVLKYTMCSILEMYKFPLRDNKQKLLEQHFEYYNDRNGVFSVLRKEVWSNKWVSSVNHWQHYYLNGNSLIPVFLLDIDPPAFNDPNPQYRLNQFITWIWQMLIPGLFVFILFIPLYIS